MSSEITIKLKPYLREFILGMLNENSISSTSKPFVGRLIKIMIDKLPKNCNTYVVFDSSDKSTKLITTTATDLENKNVKRVREAMKSGIALENVKLLKFKLFISNEFTLDETYCTIEVKRFHSGLDNRGNLYMPECNQRDFENLMDDYFRSIFFQYIEDKMRYMEITKGKAEFKKCMFDFCTDYNISMNKINYEMLKKADYRRRIEEGKYHRKTNKFSRSMSPISPLIFLL